MCFYKALVKLLFIEEDYEMSLAFPASAELITPISYLLVPTYILSYVQKYLLISDFFVVLFLTMILYVRKKQTTYYSKI